MGFVFVNLYFNYCIKLLMPLLLPKSLHIKRTYNQIVKY